MDTSKIKEISQGVKEIKNDGKTVWGGYIDKTGAPGPKRLVGGNADAGFFGEVPTSDFITGDELARRLGMGVYNFGKSQYSNEPWLKFAYMGNIEFIAKKPFRRDISWYYIDSVNAVFGNRLIEINGHTYKIRLMKGKTEGKQDDTSSHGGAICYNSEWNRLMLPISKRAPSNWVYPDNVKSPTEDWGVGYTDDDLLANPESTNSVSWCQDRGDWGGDNARLFRGSKDVSYCYSNSPNNGGPTFCWRPVLELVR